MELNRPGNGLFAKHIANIRRNVPEYNGFGRCQFPHPEEHHHEFPFADGVECTKYELAEGLGYFFVSSGLEEFF